MNQSFLFFELIGVFIVQWLILEPQTYVVVEHFGAENIPLLSGRLVGIWDELSLGTNRRLGRIVALRDTIQPLQTDFIQLTIGS